MLAGLIYVATATVVTGFCCDRNKQAKGEGGRNEMKREKEGESRRRHKEKHNLESSLAICLCGSKIPSREHFRKTHLRHAECLTIEDQSDVMLVWKKTSINCKKNTTTRKH